MANPQLENGYTPIANEILDRLAKTHLSSNQWQVLLCIIRKTYGYHKKVDYIANSQIVEATGLCKAVVSRVLHYLQDVKLIIRKGKFVGIQKDWEKWLAVSSTSGTKLAEQSTNKSKQSSQPKLAISSPELAEQSTKVSSCAVAQKIKDTITKDTIQKIAFILPSWIDKETWADFIEMRKKKRAPPAERAKQLLIRDLEKLRAAGNDPNEVLNQSIMRSYTGVFPLKGGNYSGDGRKYPASRRLPKVYKTPKQHFRAGSG